MKVENQTNGEPDFIDENSGDKYEAKMLFDEEMGRLIGDRKYGSDEWIKRFLQLRNEFGKQIIKYQASQLTQFH